MTQLGTLYLDLAERGAIDYLVFECLAERTIARENLSRLKDPEKGYTPYLVERFEAILPACIRNGIRIVTNMGAANPAAAARKVRGVARELGLGEVPVAVVTGDDVADIVRATYYITDPKDADAVFAVCGENLSEIRPAATIVAVAGLYKPEMKIEIEVTAKRRSA